MKQVATFQERLKEVIGDLSYSDLGDKIGLSKQAIGAYMTGVRTPKKPTIAAIASVFGVSPAWLCGLDAPKYESVDDPLYSLPGISPYCPTKRIPILGRISAGVPLYAEQNIEGYTWIDMQDDGEYFGLIVKGDSMDAAGIKDGYTLVIRRQDCVENGEVAVILVNGFDATVKRFYRNDNMVTLMPQSTNPAHMPQIYNAANVEIIVQGKVVEVKFKL